MDNLPADLHAALNMNSTNRQNPPTSSSMPPQSSSTTSTTPTTALPPPLASARTLTFDETIASLNRTPFFMTSLDADSTADNPLLDALKALAYEGTKVEVAANFREQGNECARGRKWGDAREFYGKALGVLRDGVPMPEGEKAERGEMELGGGAVGGGDVGEGEGQVVDVEEEERKEKEIKEACLVNRALCNLELKNYGHTTRDCLTALNLNPQNIKALYRLSLALHNLSKHTEALSTITRLLTLDPTNPSALALQKTITSAITRTEAAERDRRAHAERLASEAATLRQALKQRGIVVTETAKGRPDDAQDAVISLEDPLDKDSELRIPVLLLYPTAAQSDFIKGVSELETLGSHLEYVLEEGGLPWDEEGEFTVSSGGGGTGKGGDKVECFMETVDGGLVKIGKKMKLGKVLAGGKVDVKDGICSVFVVPKGRVEGWIGEFKRRRGKV